MFRQFLNLIYSGNIILHNIVNSLRKNKSLSVDNNISNIRNKLQFEDNQALILTSTPL
jgi:hypothetical protein